MERIPLSATARTPSKARSLRRSGQVPCVLYGQKVDNLTLQCEERALKKVYDKAGESTLVDLTVDGRTIPVLFQSIDLDPVSDRISHVDFYAVDMSKEIEAEVPVRLEGESLAVKEHGAILVTVLGHLTVKCLPSNLPPEVVVSIAKLEQFHDSIRIADVQVPEGVVILDDAEAVIVTAQEPRAEEVIEPVAPAAGDVPVAGAAAAPEGDAAATADAAPKAKKE